MANKNKLSQRQERFLSQILEGKTHTDAYLEAGYKAKDRAVASAAAARLLRNVRVRKELEHRRELIAAVSVVNSTQIIERLSHIAFTDISDVSEIVEGRLRVRDTSELHPEQLGAVESYIDRPGPQGHTLGIKLHDPTRALALMSRILGFLDGREPEGPFIYRATFVDPSEVPIVLPPPNPH